MKNSLFLILLSLSYGCASIQEGAIQDTTDSQTSTNVIENGNCIGTTDIPPQYADMFVEIEDPQLLADSLGNPHEGKLCQGKVFALKTGQSITLYRSWNSTNPNSRLGQWWAFTQPAGKVAQYRTDYEICYQWSPLDQLTECQLSPGAKIVVGTGQSATCSQYLQYPVSEVQQIYLVDAAGNTDSCHDYDGLFLWQKKAE